MAPSRKSKTDTHYVFWTTYILLALGCMVLGGTLGLVFGYAVDLPRVEELAQNQPERVSYVYARDGRIIGQFASEKRMPVAYEEIPEQMKNAVLAAEDASFFRHPGIDFGRLLATVFWDIVRWEQKGASTLTMQLSKLRFTSAEKTYERKIKDFLYAIDIEKTYSKEQIFTFYVNQILMGHGRYGIAAGADFYFHKTLDQLTLSESAVLAGIIQAPGRHSPIVNPDSALVRRNFVLREMLQEGFISEAEYREALDEPISIKGRDDQQSPAPYFVEWIRQYLHSRYPTDQIWGGGLEIHSTLDYEIQTAAQKALRDGLRAFDRKKRGWAGPVHNILDGGESLDEYYHPDWSRLFYPGQQIHGLVLESSPESAKVRLGSYTAEITPEEMSWTGSKRVSEVLRPGDVALFRLEEVDRTERRIQAELDQVPEIQGAVLVLDNRTGAIRAMCGGFDFQFSKFNRATQALRQPGSIFKPFTYVAAMEAGFSPLDQVLDRPVEFEDALGRPYSPSNWDDEFKGLITIQQALAESRNVPTVRLANALGPDTIAQVANRFGLKQEFPPYLSIALGSVEVTLEEIVSAFSVFPNHGVRAEPFYVERVEDSNGVILEEHSGQVYDAVVSPEVADKMIYLMQQVVRRGSGRPLLELGHPIGGKTGTTNESTDVWFVGFTPSLTAGVWLGYDEKKSLGDRVYGNTLALPIWKQFMSEVLKDRPVEKFESSWTPGSTFDPQLVEGDEALVEEEKEAAESERKKNPEERFRVEDIAPPPTG